MTAMEEYLYGFYQFPDSKNYWEEKIFSQFFSFKKCFKKGDFCQFLTSKVSEKISHCFSIFCDFCVSENFDMSPVDVSMVELQQILCSNNF